MNDEVTGWVKEKKSFFLKRYDHWLKKKLFFRHLVIYLHRQLNRVQYDPINPKNRTDDKPEGGNTALEQVIERDKTLVDKVETYFRLRPVSTSLLAFFVIAVAAASTKNNPEKIVTALMIIWLTLPLLLSRQDDFSDDDLVPTVSDEAESDPST